MEGPETFRFLSETRSLVDCGWDDVDVPKLWRYNLHYFDDLNAEGSQDRRAWHVQLMGRWIRENPPARGTGWDPYPTSLRIVNWIKWAWSGNELSTEAIQSLAVQARWLSKRLEWHLVGNHLFVNAKALVFAGVFFEGSEADQWRRKGEAILREQIPEQILADGGQFERSPMYHALALEDMLDLQNLTQACLDPATVTELGSLVKSRIPAMRSFLQAMTHPDGEIAFFNDAAIDVHPPPLALDAYARRLGHPPLELKTEGITQLSESGYVRVCSGNAVLIADVGRIGPDYLPGHAHADTLSFELSIGSRRVLVNSGTSEYGIGVERLRQRGTAAHNALTVSRENSSEVWGGFRVARRAAILELHIRSEGNESIVSCGHDGFTRLPGRPEHRRCWRLSPGRLEVKDSVSHPARLEAHFHWAPGWDVKPVGGTLQTIEGFGIRMGVTVVGGVPRVEPATWHPRFGQAQPSLKTVVEVHGTDLLTSFNW
jgi:uncharacterized heparinase superfamily protein